MKKILITGSLGQVGYELKRTLGSFGEVIAIDKEEMDFTSEASIRSFLQKIRPNIIVNPGAFTAVDLAEDEVDLCMTINCEAAKIIAEEAKALNALLIHYSTDYVFDGKSPKAYIENDSPNPLSIYGASKLAGEKAIQEVNGKHIILRTSWVYGTRGKNFLLTMLKLAKDKDKLSIVSDQIGAPTWSRQIAEVTAKIIAKTPYLENNPGYYGIYNVTASGKTSWLEFAEAIFSSYSIKNSQFKKPDLTGILTKDYKTRAKRPLNSLLSHEKLNKTFDIFMPHWKESLELSLEDL